MTFSVDGKKIWIREIMRKHLAQELMTVPQLLESLKLHLVLNPDAFTFSTKPSRVRLGELQQLYNIHIRGYMALPPGAAPAVAVAQPVVPLPTAPQRRRPDGAFAATSNVAPLSPHTGRVQRSVEKSSPMTKAAIRAVVERSLRVHGLQKMVKTLQQKVRRLNTQAEGSAEKTSLPGILPPTASLSQKQRDQLFVLGTKNLHEHFSPAMSIHTCSSFTPGQLGKPVQLFVISSPAERSAAVAVQSRAALQPAVAAAQNSAGHPPILVSKRVTEISSKLFGTEDAKRDLQAMAATAEENTREEDRLLSAYLEEFSNLFKRNTNVKETMACLDAAGISLKKYFKITQLSGNAALVREHTLKAFKKQLNEQCEKIFSLFDVIAPHVGVWQAPAPLLLFLLAANSLDEDDDALNLVIGGDGRNLDRNHAQTILTCRILNRRKSALTHNIL